MEVEVNSPSHNTTEKLEELDVSIITQPNIKKTKENSKKEKEKEILEKSKTENKKKNNNKKDKVTLPSTTKEESKEKPSSVNKHLTMLEGRESYNIATDLNKLTANISVAQLLDVSPKLRSELTKALKLKTPELTEENPERIMMAALNRDDVATAECIVENIKGVAFLDTCASINLITKNFFDKLKNVKPSGYTDDNIIQVFSDKNVIMETCFLKIQFGNILIQDNFRIINNNKNIFDVLIGYRTLKDNNLFINPVDNFLCKMNHNESWDRIIPLHKKNYIKELPSVSQEGIDERTRNNNEDDPLLFCFINKSDKNRNEVKIIPLKSNNIIDNNLNDEKHQILEKIYEQIPSEQVKIVKNLFKKFSKILATKLDELHGTKLLPHTIQLIDNAKPIKLKSYRLSKIQAKALKEEITKLINNKLIEPSNSPWSFPVILVLKKNGKWRMCIDFRKLNNITVKDAYSLPLIDEILFSIGKKVKYFTTIDLFSGFHQIPMNEDDIPKTSFTTMYGNYQFRVMPFGLCNAPATFQREMNRIFFPLIGECMFIYIDDLVIFSNSFEEHIRDLISVFTIIANNGLKINLEKCNFFKQKVELLGHTLSIDGIAPISNKVNVISNWIAPKNLKQLQSFLGAIGYYRKFIANYSSIAKSLYKLLKKDTNFIWGPEQEFSFYELKSRLISAPILSMPDFDKQFIIRSDASYSGIGGVLLQKDENNKEKPIHFVSRTLKPEEQNYGITDLEGTGAVYCVEKFKSYITSSKFETILYTDHKPLVGLFKDKETNNSRQTRWVLLLSMLRVKVIYEPGKKNVVADALSRLNSTKENKILATTISEDNTELMKKFKDNFVKINNVEYFKEKNSNTLRKVIRNDEEKINLTLQAHEIGHEGIFKTYNRLKRDYYWTNMILDVKYIVRTCKRCQLFRPQKGNILTEDLPTKPGYPFTKVGLDIIGPLPTTIHGNKYIVVLVDYLTKWVEAEPTGNIESEDIIQFLMKVFSRHGIPEILITDNGPQFRSDKIKSFLDLYGVYVHFTAVYHPESNGEVENRNKEIGKYLRLLCNKNSERWDEILPSALWALRTCKNETTKFSSFELLYGRRDLQPFELVINLDRKEDYESEEEFFIRKFTRHYKWIKEAINNIETANKLWEDRRKQMKRIKADYNPGDLVMVKLINRRKLDPFFVGPLKIVKKQFNTVTLCDPITNEIAERNVHLKNIVPFELCELTTSRDEV